MAVNILRKKRNLFLKIIPIIIGFVIPFLFTLVLNLTHVIKIKNTYALLGAVIGAGVVGALLVYVILIFIAKIYDDKLQNQADTAIMKERAGFVKNIPLDQVKAEERNLKAETSKKMHILRKNKAHSKQLKKLKHYLPENQTID